MIAKVLGLRRDHPELFAYGSYEPLTVEGEYSENVCAFARHLDGQSMIVMVPRLVVARLGGAMHLPVGENVWRDTSALVPDHLQHAAYRDVFSGMTITRQDGKLPLAEIFSRFPVALLISAEG